MAVADTSAAREHLASQLMRTASQMLVGREPTRPVLDTAIILCTEATQLAPNNEHTWRMLLDLAHVVEDVDLQRKAIERLVKLAPDDQVVRLKHIDLKLDEFQTVEDRITAYQRLLSGNGAKTLGPAVASRLALDVALLERRRGNTSEFAKWLAESVALDPANRSAAAMAAGYFRMNVQDAYAETELLMLLFMADPLNPAIQSTFAHHLLEHGAYHNAERICRMAVQTFEAERYSAPNSLVADLAIAQWGKQDVEAALRTIRERQRLVDTVHRRRLQDEQPGLSVLERARQTGVVSPTIATARAAILSHHNPEQFPTAMQEVVRSYEQVLQEHERAEEPDQRQIAQRRLDLAWVLLWLDGQDMQQIDELIEQVMAHQPLTDAASQRYDGWRALRRGDAETARDTLKPLAADDIAAELGHALAQLELGHRREAARGLLDVARRQPGTLLGVWATNTLWDVLGQKADITTQSTRDIEALASTLPSMLDRIPLDPTTALSIRLVPTKATFGPYEPVVVNLEIMNHAPFPLAIDREGPIRPQVALNVYIDVANTRIENLPTMVVNIDRRLRLEPRERIVVPIDLRMTNVGRVMDAYALQGATMRVKGVLNFTISNQGAVLPGVLGSERETPVFRIDGIRTTGEWVEGALADLLNRDGMTLPMLGTVSQLAGRAGMEGLSLEYRRVFNDIRAAFVDAYGSLDGTTQSWLLTVMPRVEAMQPVLEIARNSEDRLVQMMYLMFYVSSPNDPVLATARNSGDAHLEHIATLIGRAVERDDDPFDLSLPGR